jgi:hypothetical protein
MADGGHGPIFIVGCQEYWHERIAGLFDGFQADYARARGKA